MRPKLFQFTVVYDTREHDPYLFSRCDPFAVEQKKLGSGDYSIKGLEKQITVERKTKEDIYSCLGKERDRFKRLVKRMSGFEYAAIVIECGLEDFLVPPERSQMSPSAAINSLISWSVKYGVHIHFCENRYLSEIFTYRILEKFHLKSIEKPGTEKKGTAGSEKNGKASDTMDSV